MNTSKYLVILLLMIPFLHISRSSKPKKKKKTKKPKNQKKSKPKNQKNQKALTQFFRSKAKGEKACWTGMTSKVLTLTCFGRVAIQ